MDAGISLRKLIENPVNKGSFRCNRHRDALGFPEGLVAMKLAYRNCSANCLAFYDHELEILIFCLGETNMKKIIYICVLMFGLAALTPSVGAAILVCQCP